MKATSGLYLVFGTSTRQGYEKIETEAQRQHKDTLLKPCPTWLSERLNTCGRPAFPCSAMRTCGAAFQDRQPQAVDLVQSRQWSRLAAPTVEPGSNPTLFNVRQQTQLQLSPSPIPATAPSSPTGARHHCFAGRCEEKQIRTKAGHHPRFRTDAAQPASFSPLD